LKYCLCCLIFQRWLELGGVQIIHHVFLCNFGILNMSLLQGNTMSTTVRWSRKQLQFSFIISELS
jgi:hypothetical protein